MSRIGKKPVAILSGVNVSIDNGVVNIKGSKGDLSMRVNSDVVVEVDGDNIVVSPINDSKRSRSMWGMYRTMISNMIEGVVNGYEKKLEINGVGYRAQMKGKNIKLNLGFSHDVEYVPREGVELSCPSNTEIIVKGIDKQKVGQVAAEIRGYRPPEPYKGKGIKYKGEYIFRKEGKKK